MSEDNKNNIFSKRTNQFSSLKNKNKETADFEINSLDEGKDFIEKENVLNDIANENTSFDTSFDIPDGESLDNSFETSNISEDFNSSPKSLLDQYLDDDSDYSENISIEDDASDSFTNYNEPIFEDFEDADEMQISIEDDGPEDDSDDLMMNSILREADKELNKQQSFTNTEPDISSDFEESFEEQNNNYNQFEEIGTETEDTNESDEFDDFYTTSELDEKIKKGANTKDLVIKIGIGIGAVIVLLLSFLLISKLINKNPNTVTTTVTEQPPIESTITPAPTTSSNTIIDDIISSMTTNTIEEVPDESTETEEEEEESGDGIKIKTYKGYIIDIKENQLILADLSYDKYLLLVDYFNEYISKDPEEVSVRADEENKKYHQIQCECELPKETAIMSLQEATDNKYEASVCAENIGIDETKDIRDFDYSKYPELMSVIHTKISISKDSNISIKNFTIGVEASAECLFYEESYLNDLLELKPVNDVDNKPTEDKEENKPQEPVKDKNTNFWGEEWDTIVGTINDRREDENKGNQGSNNGSNTIELDKTEKYESVSTSLEIGKASIVWFQISWKSNAEVSNVPDAEDVIVELLTPNGTLINEENIDKYGKIWVDPATGLVNIVIRNTQAGEYEIVFTKTVGTYLGDVKIKAIPITGFLELTNAAAVYTDGRLEVIWNATGVKDDNCLVEIYAVNGKKKVLLYSANSLDDGIHTVDMASINVSKIAGNTYDIIIKVTDIEISPNKPYTIVAKYLSDSVTIPNIEIPEIY